jgi:hypothetical protein
MHARPASANAVQSARGRPPADPVITGHGQATGSPAPLGQAPSQARDHGSEIPQSAEARSLALAGLRRGWGEAYRITWDNGHFHATHITSGQALDAQTAAELRQLLRRHHSQRGTTSASRPAAVGSAGGLGWSDALGEGHAPCACSQLAGS